MNELESINKTALELIALGRTRGIELDPHCHAGSFLHEGRFIFLWQEDDEIRYNLQGEVTTLPKVFAASANSFTGKWHETGMLATLDDALAFVKAWLLDRHEVDDLPARQVRRQQLG